MKIRVTFGICAFLSTIATTCLGQTATVPAPTAYTVVNRTSDSTTFQRTVYDLSASGQVIPHVQSYKAVASGLNFRDPETGQWTPSREEIDILPDGTAAATNGQSQISFPSDIFGGFITSTGPDGMKLESQPLALVYDDDTNVVLVAQLTNSIGDLAASNQLVYPGALVGPGIVADLSYKYRRSGLEQDVTIRQQMPAPESFGLDSVHARLEMITEFRSPEPVQSAPVAVENGLSDVTLTFGSMKMVRGKAFSIDDLSPTNSDLAGIPVCKSWEHVGNRVFLVETVPYNRIASELSQLPASSGATTARGLPVSKALLAKILPVEHSPQVGAHRTHLAGVIRHYHSGFVLDYQEVLGSETNFVFAGDTTYLITGELDLFGTTTIEGGTVIKSPSNTYNPVVFYGPVNCETTGYLPATFTASDDNSVGSEISGSSGNPRGIYAEYAVFYCNSPESVTLHDLKINYAYWGLNMEAGSSNIIRDVQFVDDSIPLFCYEVTNYLENVLMWNATNVCIWEDYSTTIAENLTANGGSGLWNAWAEPSSLAATNCLFVGLATLDGGFTGAYNATNLSDSGVFQTVGGGSHYLAADSPYRGIGTTNIDPALLADLAQKTTWPPTVYSDTNISGLGTLSLAVPRNTNGSVDLGYNYSALDWVFAGCDLYSNLTFTAGTAVGWFEENGSVSSSGQPYGISLDGGANLSFEGNATQPCIFARYPMVQEAENGNWTGDGYMGGLMFNGGSPEPLLSGEFIKITSDGWNGNFFRDNWASGAAGFRNCEFYNFAITAYDMSYLTFTNCLFFRYRTILYGGLNFTNENCTYYNGGLAMTRDSGQSAYWFIENSSFDGTLLVFLDGYDGNTNDTLFKYNAYNTNNLSWQTYGFPYSNWTQTNILEDPGPSDVMVTNYNWETSWFGDFYLPTNSPLTQEGSTTADQVGLYEFTTQTNRIPETNAVVDIGYHYVATDANGNPLDSYVAGIPNYIVDASGSGIDTNGLPYWWEGEYFGQVGLDTNSDPDDDGNNLLYDYQHGINPNPFMGFSAQFPNSVQISAFDATVTIYSGEPFYEAVLINDTNTADAVWQPYNGTNIAVSLNSGNGIYTVSVGLRGFPSNATATWISAQVVLESLAPALTVTSPASGTVSQPVIQVQGLVSETLSNLTYDVSNALGVVSNQQGYWNPAYFDTNVDDFTTNTFQCYDVQLASGMNTITLHATDAQGNTDTASVNYTLDYSGATPPALSVLWPANGTAISGSNFTLQAQVDDDTATVAAQIVDTNGDTNTVQGLVERSGFVLVNNLPLAAGTNVLTVVATDAAGLSATNNVTLVQSSALVTVDPLNQPNQATVFVTGTISDPTCTLTVNGTNAYVDDDGDWEADNVPVSPTGTATLDVEVYSGDPLNIGSQIFAVAQPPVVAMMSYAKNNYQGGTTYNYCDAGTANASSSGTETVEWLYQSGGSDTSSSGGIDGDCNPYNTSGTTSLAGGYNGYSPTWEIDSSQSSYYEFFFYFLNHPVYQVGSDSYTANTKAMVMPTDQAGLGQSASYLVGAQVFDEDTGNQLPASALQFANQAPGTTATDVTNSGSVWTAFWAKGPAGTHLEVTPQAAGRNISFNPPWQAMTFQLTVVSNSAVQINGTTNWATVESPTNYVIVQMDVNSTNTPLLPWIETNITWSGGTTVPGNPLQCEVSTAVSTNVTVTASIGSFNASLEVWVIWSTVQILVSGTNPTNAPQFGTLEDGTENLGIQYFNGSNTVAGKMGV